MERSYKIIAVDFDGTLCSSNWPYVGYPNLKLLNKLRAEKEAGNKIILWTCRTMFMLEQAVDACKSWGLELDAVNENIPETLEMYNGITGNKITADIYIDDLSTTPWDYIGVKKENYEVG